MNMHNYDNTPMQYTAKCQFSVENVQCLSYICLKHRLWVLGGDPISFPFVRPCVHPSVQNLARGLKFHIWIPHKNS